MPPDSAVTMADAEVDLDDEQYDSTDDEDFTLDQAADEDDAELSSSDDEGETAVAGEPAAKKRKTTKAKTGDVAAAAAEDAELDSGDEAMIRKAEKRKRKRKAGKKGAAAAEDDEDDVDFDEDEGGTGGFVRTRAMKMRMYGVLKPL